ncbi:hypothetical protein NFI96_023321 [Prochilodus magdalenae]|nr:hypothetical protein NFI96_023321 [Prochilodus magdalenae]
MCNFAPVMMGPKWKVTAPGNLQTFEGSCLVIPCTFEYGNCSEESTPEKGIWFKKMDMEDRKDYGPGLELTPQWPQSPGDNCPLASFLVMQPVIRMEEVEVGSPATVTCSVNYTCSSDPPDLSWSHKQRGNASLVHSQDEGQWTLTSDLTFQTKDSDLDTWINCTAKYNTLPLLAHQAVMLQLGCSVPILYIIISVFTAVIVFLLAATLALWRYKSQKREVENKRESKQTEIPKNNKSSAKARRPDVLEQQVQLKAAPPQNVQDQKERFHRVLSEVL